MLAAGGAKNRRRYGTFSDWDWYEHLSKTLVRYFVVTVLVLIAPELVSVAIAALIATTVSHLATTTTLLVRLPMVPLVTVKRTMSLILLQH